MTTIQVAKTLAGEVLLNHWGSTVKLNMKIHMTWIETSLGSKHMEVEDTTMMLPRRTVAQAMRAEKDASHCTCATPKTWLSSYWQRSIDSWDPVQLGDFHVT